MSTATPVYTAPELARLLGVSRSHVHALAHKHPEISAAVRHAGRRTLFSKAQIDAYLGNAPQAAPVADFGRTLLLAELAAARAKVTALEAALGESAALFSTGPRPSQHPASAPEEVPLGKRRAA